MSADNGIYILPLKDGFYVAYCLGVDDLWYDRRGKGCYDPETVVRLFSLSRKCAEWSVAHFNTQEEASAYANRRAQEWYDNGDILEHGVSLLDHQDHTMAEFVQMAQSDRFDMSLDDLAKSDAPPESKYVEVATLPNGCALFRKDNGVGGHTYTSDEVGGGVHVWDTCLVAESTLLAAMVDQSKVLYEESIRKHNESQQSDYHGS